MRKRVIGLFHSEIRGLHQAAYLLALFTLCSQLLAIVRDRLLAGSFGAGETLDLYYAAFRVPDTLYVLIASLVSVFVLIPFLEDAERSGKDAMHVLLSDLFTFLMLSMGTLAAVAFWFAPFLCDLLFGQLYATAGEELVLLVRVLLLQPILLGVSNLFAAYVQVKGRFLVYAVAPLLYNMGIIAGVVFLYEPFGTVGLAYGVVLGALLHLLVQASYLLSERMVPRFKVPRIRLVVSVVLTSLPRALALSAQQLSLLVLVSLASLFAAGSVASFSLAYNLQAVPIAIIGASYSVAAFPKLARLFMAGDKGHFVAIVVTATRQILFWAFPVIVLFIVLRAQIVRVILGSGKFDWNDTMLTAAVLALFVVSLAAQCLVVLLVRAFYAAERTWTPVAVSTLSALFVVVLAFYITSTGDVAAKETGVLASYLRVYGVAGASVLHLALMFSIGSIMNAVVLMVLFERSFGPYLTGLARPALDSLCASLVAGLGAYLALAVLAAIVSMQTVLGVFLQGLGAGLTGLVLWLLVLTALNNREVAIAWDTIESRLRQTSPRDLRGTIDT